MGADQRLIPDAIRDDSTLALNELIHRLGTVDITPVLIYLIDEVTDSALPHLLDQFHVAGIEGGTLAENATNRRRLIKGAIALHRLKGTPAGLKAAIRDAGFGEASIIERPGELTRNGTARRNALYTHGANPGQWVNYHLIMQRTITIDQAVLIRELCNEFAPARCKLNRIVYTEALLRRNGRAQRNGNYTRGVI